MEKQKMTREELESDNKTLEEGFKGTLDILDQVWAERDDLRVKLFATRAILIFLTLITLILLALVVQG
jgi:hypothetical protein